MSKAFTKDDAEETPLLVPPRPPLPAGTPNYVTARGLSLLRDELAGLEGERSRVYAEASDDAERARRLAVLGARIGALATRVASARLVDAHAQPHDEVRFGATITLRTVTGTNAGEERRLTIVGVDEAEAAEGRVAFLAPIACAVLGLGIGDTATLRTAGGEEVLEVTAIDYEEAGGARRA